MLLAPLIAVVGPTGAGKSHLSLILAHRFHGEIVNCDSIQVYRQLNIGSAKLPPQERQGVPHHLIDLIDVRQELTAGAYARLARPVLSGISQRRHLPMVVGGTGFYLRALLDGLSPAPLRDEQLRSRLAEIALRHPRVLHRFLRRHDPASASRIHPNDHQKLIRAIELTLLARRPASQTQSQPKDALPGFKVLKLGLQPDRTLLRQALDQRTAEMFQHGLLTETGALLESGVPPHSKALQSLGYKQAIQVLTEGRPVREAIAECQARTRQYAKRQLTWFRSDPSVHWLHGFGSDPAVETIAIAQVEAFLNCENDSRRNNTAP